MDSKRWTKRFFTGVHKDANQAFKNWHKRHYNTPGNYYINKNTLEFFINCVKESLEDGDALPSDLGRYLKEYLRNEKEGKAFLIKYVHCHVYKLHWKDTPLPWMDCEDPIVPVDNKLLD